MCGRCPSPARVLRVAFGRTAASLSSTGAKKGGLSEPPVSRTGRSKRASAGVSRCRVDGGGRAGALDDRGEVGDVLVDAALRGQALALAVPAPVVDDDAEALGEARDGERPFHVVGPRPVHQYERVAGAILLEVDADPVDVLVWHAAIIRRWLPLAGGSLYAPWQTASISSPSARV